MWCLRSSVRSNNIWCLRSSLRSNNIWCLRSSLSNNNIWCLRSSAQPGPCSCWAGAPCMRYGSAGMHVADAPGAHLAAGS